jgi:doublecortin-like kinase 3
MGFVHCDVKPENIVIHSVVDKIPQIWLCDFGLTKSISDATNFRGICGTEFYQSPEIFKRSGFTEKVDEWSAGVILHRLLTGLCPVMSRSQMNERALEANFKGIAWTGITEAAKGLVHRLLALDPKKRISGAEGLQAEWLRPLAKKNIQQQDEESETSETSVSVECRICPCASGMPHVTAI